MKKLIYIIGFFIIAASNIQAKDITAFLSYSIFNTPEKGPFIETNLSIIGNSVSYKKQENGKFQASIEISIAFVQDNQIKNFKKYNLLSPEIEDTVNGSFPNFLDQQRLALENGTYDMEIEIKDNNKESKAFKSSEKISINFPENKLNFSSVQLVESYTKSTQPGILTKSGYDLIPYVSTFYPVNLKSLTFYVELYNSDVVFGDQRFLFNYYIESYETNVKLTNYNRFQKEAPGKVKSFIGQFSIEELPSGNYNLIVEVRDSKNELALNQKIFFQRSNPKAKLELSDINAVDVNNTFASRIASKDSLREHIKSLYPISNSLENTFAQNQLNSAELILMQKFFYNFWQSRDQLNPEQAWLDYYEEVKKVNKTYGSTLQKGYATDRGRVYLQYGAPNASQKYENEMGSYPYEIWQYYQLKNSRSNRKFIFYNYEIAGNNYKLLHSDAPGENFDARWQLKLRRRTMHDRDMDNENTPDSFGNRANENFADPK